MNRALWRKNFSESWLLLTGCGVALWLFCWMRVWIVGQLEMDRFQRILENLPEVVQRLLPVPIEQLFSYAGRVALGFEEPIVYLVMAVWAIARGSDSVSGELGRGTLEMLLAQPVSRLRVLTYHCATALLGVIVLAGVAYVATAVGIHTTTVLVTPPARSLQLPWLGIDVPLSLAPPAPQMVPLREVLDPVVLLPAVVNYASLGFFLVGLTTFLSSFDSYRWRTIGLAVGFYVLQTLVELLAVALESDMLRRLTFFAAYDPVRFVIGSLEDPQRGWQLLWSEHPLVLGPLGCDLVLVMLGIVGLALAAVIFHRRDLSAPV